MFWSSSTQPRRDRQGGPPKRRQHPTPAESPESKRSHQILPTIDQATIDQATSDQTTSDALPGSGDEAAATDGAAEGEL